MKRIKCIKDCGLVEVQLSRPVPFIEGEYYWFHKWLDNNIAVISNQYGIRWLIRLSGERELKSYFDIDVTDSDGTVKMSPASPEEAIDPMVNHPSHYTWLKDKCGVEVIDITRWLPSDIGNAVKYLLRFGHKHEEGMDDKAKAKQDLEKALFYINDHIENCL